jgi:hypothetical protein
MYALVAAAFLFPAPVALRSCAAWWRPASTDQPGPLPQQPQLQPEQPPPQQRVKGVAKGGVRPRGSQPRGVLPRTPDSSSISSGQVVAHAHVGALH